MRTQLSWTSWESRICATCAIEGTQRGKNDGAIHDYERRRR